jgi:molecular chaperone GrpE
MSNDKSVPNGARPEAAAPGPSDQKPAKGADMPAAADAASGAEAAREGGDQSKLFAAAREKLRKQFADDEKAKLKEEADAAATKIAELEERHVRLLAEMENLRRRTEREKTDTAKFAITRFARDVLTVADNFQRAIDSVPTDVAAGNETLASFLDGIRLTEQELLNVLDRHGVKRVDPAMGDKFDPNIHQAMMQAPSAEVPAGHILQVFQPAYLIEDRILRAAAVVVSTGAPQPAANDVPDAGGTAPGPDAGSPGADSDKPA